jgi:hypothetical protein
MNAPQHHDSQQKAYQKGCNHGSFATLFLKVWEHGILTLPKIEKYMLFSIYNTVEVSYADIYK